MSGTQYGRPFWQAQHRNDYYRHDEEDKMTERQTAYALRRLVTALDLIADAADRVHAPLVQQIRQSEAYAAANELLRAEQAAFDQRFAPDPHERKEYPG